MKRKHKLQMIVAKKKQQQLLMEPSIEEEVEAERLERVRSKQDELVDNSTTDNHNVISKSRRRRELGSLFVLLFGLFVFLSPLQSAAQLDSRSSSHPVGRELNGTSSRTASLVIASQPSSSLPSTAPVDRNSTASTATITTTTTTTTAVTDEDVESEFDSSEESTSKPEEEETPQKGLDRRFVLEAAAELADKLTEKLETRIDDQGEPEEPEVSSPPDSKPLKERDLPLNGGRPNSLRSTSDSGSRNDNRKLSNNDQKDAETLKMALETYSDWRTTGDDIIELFSRKFLPLILDYGYELDGSSVSGFVQWFGALRALKPWALRLLDASGKISPGILRGSQSDFGDFDECLSVRVDDPAGLATTGSVETLDQQTDPQTGLPTSTVIGRYCLADVEFPKPARRRDANGEPAFIELRRPLFNFSQSAAFRDTIFVETANFFHMLHVDPIRIGICLTNKIEPASFSLILNKLLEPFKVSLHFRHGCVTKYDRPIWTTYQRTSAWVLSIACSLVFVSTLLELILFKLPVCPPTPATGKSSSLVQVVRRHQLLLTSFSIIRNTKRLFKQRQLPVTWSIDNDSPIGARFLNPIGAAKLKCSTGSVPVTFVASSAAHSISVESSPSIERRLSQSALGSETASSGSGSLYAPSSQALILPSTGGRVPSLPTSSCNLGHLGYQLTCLDGIRVLTMAWMIVNHTYMFGGFFVLWAHRRLIDIAEWPKSLSFQLVLNGWLTVETYFFLSALIIMLTVMPLMKRRKFSYGHYLLHRLLRIVPAYSGLICLNFLWPLISSGPVWMVKGSSFIEKPCENYVWTNFLFINNWIWPEKQCMVHTWFLSADFQLYLLAPISVYLLYRRPVLGHSFNMMVALVASVFSGLVIYANKLMPTTLINKLEFDAIKQQLSYSYFATYQHMGPYCLGLFIGYSLHKRPQVRLPRHLTWSLWLVLPPLSLTTLLLTYLWNGAYEDDSMVNPSPLVSALYVGIHRTIWTSLLAWLVFACATGRARLLSSFLSHSIFVPLSRLSFSIYLVHLPVIMYRALNLRHTVEWTDANILWEASGNFMASLLAAYFLNICFESPVVNLERLITGQVDDLRDRRASLSTSTSSGPKQSAISAPLYSPKMDSSSSERSSSSSSSSSSRNGGRVSQPEVNYTQETMATLTTTSTANTNAENSSATDSDAAARSLHSASSNAIGKGDFTQTTLGAAPAGALQGSFGDLQRIEQLNLEAGTLARRRRLLAGSSSYTGSVARPSQYATLASSGRLDRISGGHNAFDSAYMRSSSTISRASRRIPAHGYAHSHSQTLGSGHSRRTARYNTLASDWRLTHFRPDVEPTVWPLQGQQMIPRIDSTTLRRHPRRPEGAGPSSSSIVEEELVDNNCDSIEQLQKRQVRSIISQHL